MEQPGLLIEAQGSFEAPVHADDEAPGHADDEARVGRSDEDYNVKLASQASAVMIKI